MDVISIILTAYTSNSLDLSLIEEKVYNPAAATRGVPTLQQLGIKLTTSGNNAKLHNYFTT